MGNVDLENVMEEIIPDCTYLHMEVDVNLQTICKNIISSMDTRSILFQTEDKSITIKNVQT
jgi:hypothetical protein